MSTEKPIISKEGLLKEIELAEELAWQTNEEKDWQTVEELKKKLSQV